MPPSVLVEENRTKYPMMSHIVAGKRLMKKHIDITSIYLKTLQLRVYRKLKHPFSRTGNLCPDWRTVNGMNFRQAYDPNSDGKIDTCEIYV